jgi:hypothetical protein
MNPTETKPPVPKEPLLASVTPQWKSWLVRLVVFTVAFGFVLVALTALGSIVESFFITLYTE